MLPSVLSPQLASDHLHSLSYYRLVWMSRHGANILRGRCVRVTLEATEAFCVVFVCLVDGVTLADPSSDSVSGL